MRLPSPSQLKLHKALGQNPPTKIGLMGVHIHVYKIISFSFLFIDKLNSMINSVGNSLLMPPSISPNLSFPILVVSK